MAVPLTSWPSSSPARDGSRGRYCVGVSRASAPRRLLPAAALLAVVAVLSGCAADGGTPLEGTQTSPQAQASTGGGSDSPQQAAPHPAAPEQCAVVSELYLSLTLLPLAEEDGAPSLDPAATAEDVRDAAEDAPAAVQDDFRGAAGLLEGYGAGLEPQELDELRTRLDPVDLWIGRRCSG